MSDLVQELAKEVTQDNCLQGQTANFLRRFQVNDLLCDKQNLKVVLLCESPHTDETRRCKIEERYPLAGNSGKNVTKVLWKYALRECASTIPGEAIGKLVKDRDPCFKWLGVMNVSQFPLQATAYCRNQEFYGQGYTIKNINVLLSLLHNFETIQGNPGANTERRVDQAKRVDKHMQNDLKCRLGAIGNLGILYVLCGNVAQAVFRKIFFRKVKNVSTYKCNTVCVSHPNTDGWKEKEGEDIDRQIMDMCEKIKCAL